MNTFTANHTLLYMLYMNEDGGMHGRPSSTGARAGVLLANPSAQTK